MGHNQHAYLNKDHQAHLILAFSDKPINSFESSLGLTKKYCATVFYRRDAEVSLGFYDYPECSLRLRVSAVEKLQKSN